MNSKMFASRLDPAVYIVGAGPGDPELLTVKAQKLIEQADVLVYANSLVPKQILSAIRPNAEKIATASMTLEDIVPLMVERVKAGKAVVRLHSGDPSLYSAIGEQMRRLAEADVPFEVVPGISAFQAAAATLQVELTVPNQVQSIILTRISGRTQVPEAEELSGLAAHQASLCLYLSARHIETAQNQLLAHYAPQTPVAICFRVGWPDEQIQVVPLQEMAAVSQALGLVRTTLYLVSPALKLPSLDQPVGTHKRSRLYSPDHDHLFRAKGTATRRMAASPETKATNATAATAIGDNSSIETPSIKETLKKEQEQGKR